MFFSDAWLRSGLLFFPLVALGCGGSLMTTLDAGGGDAGFVADSGQPAPDAGVDAGAPDGGSDGGTDAGTPDAGRCDGGRCTPQLLVDNRIIPLDVGTTQGHVLWLEYGPTNNGLDGELNRIKKTDTCLKRDGGCVEDLNTQLLGRFRVASMTVADDAFCWLEWYEDRRNLRCQSLTTGVERWVAQNLPFAQDLRRRGDELLWVQPGATGGLRTTSFAADASVNPSVVVSGRGRPYSAVSDADAFYWTESGFDGGGSIWTIARGSGNAPVALVRGALFPLSLHEHGDSLYWAEYSGNVVRAVQKDGGSLRTLGTGVAPAALAVDDTGVYWLTQGTGPNYLDGELWRSDHDGGRRLRLAENLQATWALTLDSDGIFWTTQGTQAANFTNGKVWRVLRPDLP